MLAYDVVIELLTWPDFLSTITSPLILKLERGQMYRGGTERAEEQANDSLIILTVDDFGSLLYAVHRFFATNNMMWLKSWFDNQSLPRLKKHGYEMIERGTFNDKEVRFNEDIGSMTKRGFLGSKTVQSVRQFMRGQRGSGASFEMRFEMMEHIQVVQLIFVFSGNSLEKLLALCLRYYDDDLIWQLKNLGRYDTFKTIDFAMGGLEWTMSLSMGYKFELSLVSLPSAPSSQKAIHKLEFVATVRFREIAKEIRNKCITVTRPRDGLVINSLTHYFALKDIAAFDAFSYELDISALRAFDAKGEDITDLFIADKREICKTQRVWTTTMDPLLVWAQQARLTTESAST